MPPAQRDESHIGACPVPRESRRVLVFGGTFDPVTLAHTTLAECAARAINADWTLFVPAKRNPLKAQGPSASDADRVEMLRLALSEMRRVGICTLEIEREGVSYTIETVRELRRRLGPSVALRLLIGADQVLAFHRWREHEALVGEAEPVVVLRPPLQTREAFREAMAGEWGEAAAAAWAARIVEAPLLDIAASEVRKAIERAGVHSEGCRALLHPAIAGYIADKGLYSGSP